jgi:tetratricopeptide (TPR) repeat protein
MGVVFRARDLRLQRTVAIKVLNPALATASAAERFIREAQALARAAHPHVVVVHDVVAEPEGREGLFYFVMEYLDGEPLSQRLVRGRLAPQEARRLGADLLAGLVAVHQAGLVHRDIKPGNIFLANGRAKLGDFGIARMVEGGDSSSSSASQIVGTPDYMAPEQRRGGVVDQRSDIYQAAAVLYESVTGRRWLEVEASPEAAWGDVPRHLREVLQKGLAWEAGDRWPDAAGFRLGFLGAVPRRRPPMLRVGVGVMALAAVAYTVWANWPQRPTRPPSVELTVLRFKSDADSALAHRLGRYTGEPLDRFTRIVTRPLVLAMGYPWPRTAAELEELNTDFYVEGELRGDTLSLDVYRREGRLAGRILVPRDATALSPLAWGRAAADSIVHRFFPAHYLAYHSVAGEGGSDDALAVDEFLSGEDAYHHDEYRLAEIHYENALDRDPRFAIAGWHLLVARRSLRESSVDDVRGTSSRYGAMLPPLYRELLDIMVEDDLVARFSRYREVVAQYPENRFARMLYADDLFHLGPLIGLPLDTALAELKRAAAIDPHRQLGPEQDHTIWVNLRLGRERDAGEALQRREQTTSIFGSRHSREGVDRTKFWNLALAERFTPWKAELYRWWFYRRPDSTRLRQTQEYMRLALSMDIPACQLALGAIVSRHATEDRVAGLGHEAEGLALLALGRPQAALAQLDSATRRFGSTASRLERGEWALLLPLFGVPVPDSLRRIGESEVRLMLRDSTIATRAAWALAVADIASGRSPGREDVALLADRAAHDMGAERLLRLLQALEAGQAGRYAEAIAMSDTLTRAGPVVRVGDPFARAALYLHRAGWQMRLGRAGDAIRTLGWVEHTDLDGWAQGEAQTYDVDLALSSVVRARLAIILQNNGRTVEACAVARRVGELWRDAEPVLAARRDSLTMEFGGCPR